MNQIPHQDTPALPLKQTPPAISISGMPGMMSGRRGVPLSVPLPFLLTSICAAAILGCLLPWSIPEAMLSPGFPHVLALVHTTTLGWLTMAIIGASLQLAPVIVVAPLRATRFIRWQYPVYFIGVVLLVSGFWEMRYWLIITGGTLVILAVIHYVVVLSATLAHATTRPLTVRFLVASLIYLCIVVSLGLTAALNLQFEFLGSWFDSLLLTHITLGIIGWLSCTLIGVSYTLVRLFALVHGHVERLGRLIFLILNGSIVGLALGFLFSWLPLIIVGWLMLIAAAWVFAYDYTRMLRIRRRKVLDVTQYHGIASVISLSLVIPLAMGVFISGWYQPSVLLALGLMAFIGWLGQSVIGYLYKIVPFLVWHARYGHEVGRMKVPLMRDLVHERWSWASFWLINIGLIAAVVTTLLQWIILLQLATALLGIGLLLTAANVIAIVSHLYRRSHVLAV